MTGLDDRIRILWLAKGLGPGGMERLLVNHAKAGDRDRFVYYAAYLVERPNSVVRELEELGVPCVNLQGGTNRDPRWLARLREVVRRERIDVVHAHSPMPAAMSRPVVRSMGRRRPRLVYTEHNNWNRHNSVTRLMNAATYRLDDAQFAVSVDTKASIPSYLASHVEVLRHGIDLETVASYSVDRERVRSDLGVAEDDVVIINPAHLRKEKAQEILLMAASNVIREHPNVVFLSIGHGPRESELKELHNDLGLGDRFRFLGFRSDVLSLLAASDIFCLSSRQEGLPVSFMEATALGLPTVTTAVGGLSDYVVPGTTGLLVQPDDVDGLATALSTLIGDDLERSAMGHHSLARADQFSSLPAVRRQEAVYEAMVGATHR